MAEDQTSTDRVHTDKASPGSVEDTRNPHGPTSLSGLVGQGHTASGSSTADDTMRMSALAAALPSEPVQNYGHHGQRYNVAGMRQIPHYAAQNMQAQIPQYQAYGHSPGQPTSPIQYSPYIDQQGMGVPYSPMQGQFPGSGLYGTPQPSPQFGGFPHTYGMPAHGQPHGFQGAPSMYSGQEYGPNSASMGLGGNVPGPRSMYPPQASPRSATFSASSSVPAAPRGPPRKPKQSGHALWVGNLPPGTQVGDLKDHFARDATKEIESVFLISKSNCAFVNYKSESACAAAMNRFHDSRFQGVRLVCRLRKGPGSISSPSGGNTSAPSGPAALQSGSTQSQSAVDAISQNRESSAKAMEVANMGEHPVNDKYFIVKSLTVEDLELSVRNGIWATQGHNEDALNKAYETVENVYLVFSANKSGEYFGYARMDSPINDETAKNLEWKPFEEHRTTEAAVDPELPRSIPTSATESAPKGRIIDDSARGTIFWEADSDSDNEQQGESGLSPGERAEEDNDSSDGETGEQSGEPNDEPTSTSAEVSHQTFGRPFRVRWVSTLKLPFYRTRGLRNPWNANREVKIARDGTELETSVGRRLVAMFHRAPLPQQVQAAQMQGQQAFMGQLPPQMRYGPGPMSPGRY